MKRIKVFSLILALGLGLTATFAFKEKKAATEVGILNGAYSYAVLGFTKYIVINSAIKGVDIDGINYACVVYDNMACEVVYSGPTPTFTDGDPLYLNSNDIIWFSDQNELISTDD